ncbi:MAG: 1-acyl-sn-glycerol-3-phosphate acyltransferase [Blastocatellia bacterium]
MSQQTQTTRRDSDDSESLVKRWGRRAITVTLYTLLCLAILGSLPALMVVAVVADLARGSNWAGVRFVALVAFYFCCEVAGIAMSFLLWLARVVTRAGSDRFLDWNFALQQWWAGSLFQAGRFLFSLGVEVEGAEALGQGPFIVLMRHVSLGDTLLPSTILSKLHGLKLRYVLKSQLLWDPCLDIVGHRLPNCFVRRGAGDEMAISSVGRLMDDLRTNHGVLIYPEGTRFTHQKRERILKHLANGDRELFRQASALEHVLPPRLGGTLALLDRNESADALFCGHVGLEGVTDFRDFLRGSMVGAVLRVRFWRVAFDEIPRGRAAQTAWLYEHWTRLDEWVGEQSRFRLLRER